MHKGRLLACDTPSGVKGLMKGTLLEVRCPEARKAALLLKSSGIGSVALFGDRLHVVVEDPVRGRDALEATMRRGGLRCDEIRVAEPSLEDVFTSALLGESAGVRL